MEITYAVRSQARIKDYLLADADMPRSRMESNDALSFKTAKTYYARRGSRANR